MDNQKENLLRINKVKKYIEENVDQKLPLEKLAEIANFSPFHFQRIFKSIEGETGENIKTSTKIVDLTKETKTIELPFLPKVPEKNYSFTINLPSYF